MNLKILNRRGVALELAIVTLLVIFALCSILLIVAELGVSVDKKISENVVDRAEIEKIGDDFVACCKNNKLFDAASYEEKYLLVLVVEELYDGKSLTVKDSKGERVLLYVQVEDDGDIVSFIGKGSDSESVMTPGPDVTPRPEPLYIPIEFECHQVVSDKGFGDLQTGRRHLIKVIFPESFDTSQVTSIKWECAGLNLDPVEPGRQQCNVSADSAGTYKLNVIIWYFNEDVVCKVVKSLSLEIIE